MHHDDETKVAAVARVLSSEEAPSDDDADEGTDDVAAADGVAGEDVSDGADDGADDGSGGTDEI